MKNLIWLLLVLSSLAFGSSATFISSGGGGGSGITSLNGLTAASQVFANGSTGTAPAFVSGTSTHTLNIPLASAGGVTAGLISKTNFDAFNGKVSGPISSTAGDVPVYADTSGAVLNDTTLQYVSNSLRCTTDAACSIGLINANRFNQIFAKQSSVVGTVGVTSGDVGTLLGAVPSNGVVGTSTTPFNFTEVYGSNGTSVFPGFYLVSARGTAAAPAPLQSQDLMGGIFSGGNAAAGVFRFYAGRVGFVAAENWSSTASGTDFSVNVTRNTTNLSDVALLLRGVGTGAFPHNTTMDITGYGSKLDWRQFRHNGSFESPTAVVNGNILGAWSMGGAFDTTQSQSVQAATQGQATESWGVGARGTKLNFLVTPNTTTTALVAGYWDNDLTLFASHAANLGTALAMFAENAPSGSNDGLVQIGSEGDGAFPSSIVEMGSQDGYNAHLTFVYSADGSTFTTAQIRLDETSLNLDYFPAGTAFNFHSNVVIADLGFGLQIKEGANATSGRATLVAGTATVSNTLVAANTEIQLTCQDANGGIPGVEYVGTRVPGTSFVITSSAADTCIVHWLFIKPAP